MIGQMINKFDNYPEEKQIVKEFNKLFKHCKLEAHPNKPVEIGELKEGNRRMVWVGDKPRLHAFPPVTNKKAYDVAKKPKRVIPKHKIGWSKPKEVVLFYLGKQVNEFISLNEAARGTGISRQALQYGLNKKQVIKNGYQLFYKSELEQTTKGI